MKTKFLTIIISLFVYATAVAQTPDTRITLDNDVHTQHEHAGSNRALSHISTLDPGRAAETGKDSKDRLYDSSARIKGSLDHVGAYNFGSRMIWLAHLRIFFYKRKPRTKN